MPESEPKPKLIELVAPGAGQGWKATLKNGKAVVIHEIAAPAAEAAAAVPRIQRLAEHPHPALAPVLAWGTDPNGVWVAAEPNEGVPLGTILSRGPLTPPAAAALGAAVLSGVAALHEAGIAMGGFGAAAIRVTSNGEVRLSGHPAAAVRGAPSQSDLRADVRSCGMAICAAFGVDPAGAPAPPGIPPGLVVTMRSMASGAMGPAADRAQGALREMASALLAPDRATASQAELALRAGGREMPAITPFLPKETFPPGAAPAQQQPPGLAPWGTPASAAPSPPQRDQTPIRAPASYDAPPRPMETYPPGTPGVPSPVPPPYVPPQLRDEPAPAGASYEPPPRSPSTFPIITPPVEAPPPPTSVPTWQEEKPAAQSSPQATWGGVPIAPPPEAPAPPPPAPEPPAASTWDPGPPPAAAPAPAPEPPAAEARPTWTSIPTPSSTAAADVASTPAAPTTPTPTPAPAVPAYVAPAPATYTSTPAPAPVPDLGPARKPPAPRRPVRDQATERPPWLVPAAAAIVILLLLGVGFGIFSAIRGGSNHNVGVTSPGTSPKTSPKATPKTSPKTTPSPVGGPLQTVPTYAPPSSDPITRVQFCLTAAPCQGATSADTNCTLNSSCHVDIGIYYSAAVGQLTYYVNFFDRCTGTTTEIFKRTDTPNPTYRIFLPAPNGGFAVTIPTAKAASIVVVAEAGSAKAASTPYDLPGSASSCA
jgi:hypothetical protein